MSRTKVLFVCTMVATLVLLAGSALAATTPAADTLKVDYYANAGGSTDATVRIINPGTTYTTLCADIYVFAANEEINECCSCPVTPDDMRTLSVNTDLLGNPATGNPGPTTGDFKIVSAAQYNRTCPIPDGHPASGGAAVNPTPAVRVFTTHIENNGTLTEDVSPDATLSASELSALQAQCYAIVLADSGHGICSCGTGE